MRITTPSDEAKHGSMDHHAVIASLTPEQRNRLTEKSDAAGLAQLAVHCGLLILIGTAISLGVPFWWLLLLPQGLLIAFLFTLLHEAVHLTPFRSGWLNALAARVSGFLLLLPPDWFRYFHFAHHRYTQDSENDPELATRKPDTVLRYIAHVSGIPFWWGAVKGLFVNAAGRNRAAYIPPKGHAKVAQEARVMLCLYTLFAGVSVYFQSTLLLWIWVVPALIGQPFLRVFLLAEHAGCPFLADMLQNTRTTRTIWLVRRLAWNMPYHAEHHSYPGVPFHRLPELHAVIERHVAHVENGYMRFNAKYVQALR
ncbi:MAG TPA: fatty acid desaturase [Stellaceae bacterium]|nr:fatty acid desaturase [Stellaceae bacterium]